MGAWGLSLGVLHCLGVYIHLCVGDKQNTADALFTETPHDVSAQPGEDVEMACSFRGSGDIPYSLEIQWWYTRSHKDWANKETWANNQQKSLPGTPEKGATKISVVKVFGSNISHKLRLSHVKISDEGTYECRVLDYSDGKGRQHRVKAFLRVEAESGRRGTVSHRQQDTSTHRHFQVKELKKRAAGPCEQCQV